MTYVHFDESRGFTSETLRRRCHAHGNGIFARTHFCFGPSEAINDIGQMAHQKKQKEKARTKAGFAARKRAMGRRLHFLHDAKQDVGFFSVCLSSEYVPRSPANFFSLVMYVHRYLGFCNSILLAPTMNPVRTSQKPPSGALGLGLLFISMENERKEKDSYIQTMQWFHSIVSYATVPEWKSRCKRVHAYSVCVDTRPEKATTEYIMCQVVSDA